MPSYDEETARVLKALLNARHALDGIESEKRAVREVPELGNPGLLAARSYLRDAENELTTILARAADEARVMGL